MTGDEAAALEAASEELGGTVTWGDRIAGSRVRGASSGLAVEYIEALGYSAIVAKLSAKLDTLLIEIHVGNDYVAEQASRGKYVDIVTGDAAFDELCVVEGAPADVVCAALDDATRAWLRDVGEGTLQLRDGIDVHFQCNQLAAHAVPAAIRAVAAFAAGLPDAIRRAALARESATGGDPYRPSADGEVARRREDGARSEVVALQRVRETRIVKIPRAMFWTTFGLVLLGLAYCAASMKL